jgi:hypothetical protein
MSKRVCIRIAKLYILITLAEKHHYFDQTAKSSNH